MTTWLETLISPDIKHELATKLALQISWRSQERPDVMFPELINH